MADHGIVVGINNYPELGWLDGPCNDAIAFFDWLVHPAKGGVDPDNVKKLLSSDFPRTNESLLARPKTDDVFALFHPLTTRAARDEHTDGRLFVYVAGHGFADIQDQSSSALYAADAALAYPTHLAVAYCTNWLIRHWAFDEVILIMDCCRYTNALHEISRPALPRTSGHENYRRVKTFTGFGANWMQAARERDFDGQTRGIFSVALLDALENAKPNRAGRVTGKAVAEYIFNVFSAHAGGIEVGEPDIMFNERKDVCFVSRQDSIMEVQFSCPAEYVGRTLTVFDHLWSRVEGFVVNSTSFVVPLSAGAFYTCAISGIADTIPFQVTSDEVIQL